MFQRVLSPPVTMTATSPASAHPQANPDILGPLAAIFYALFTLLPDSSSVVVSWPWVFIWQVALLLPWLWLLRQGWVQSTFPRLGFGLDYGTGVALLVLVGSTGLASFPQQARWYGWAALCSLAALYALNGWCNSPSRRMRLLNAQGGLSVAFILTSLGLWSSQTLLPELTRLQGLRAAGLAVTYDFAIPELRNWAPLGHQNYVAGYLVLSLPLLLGLSLTAKGWWRGVWALGVVLGLVDLYTASSRGGWLGLALAGLCGVLVAMSNPRIPLKWRGLSGLGLLAVLVAMVLTNNRLRSLLSPATLDATGGETAFRLITNTAGWAMGLAHPWFGAGPGSVPLLYQAYRPAWAGREAELVYQLHSTPAQIWAEFGAAGIGLTLGVAGWLVWAGIKIWRSRAKGSIQDNVLAGSLLVGFVGYGVMSITDYQLDIVAISGLLMVYSASLLSLLRDRIPTPAPVPNRLRLSWIRWGIVGLLVAVLVWLAPIHRAWQLSSLAFSALSQKQIEPFVAKLQEAQHLAPWEPYYANQLGWNLANLSLQNNDPQTRQAEMVQGLAALRQSVALSPHQEFSHSNLGWLQLITGQPTEATQSFLQATRLMPAKRGGFHSLGLSLLAQRQTDLALQALALEIVRNPIWLTSPVWKSAQLEPLAPQVQATAIKMYRQLLQERPVSDPLTAYLNQCLGGVYWWQGDRLNAESAWRKDGTPLGQTMLAIAQNQAPSTGSPILKAWLDPQRRSQWIEKALLDANQSPPDPQQVQTLLVGMNQSKSFEDWIRQHAPIAQYRRERAGFGVLSRHIDGPAPLDFFPVADNLAMKQFFAALLPSPDYNPSLDKALQPFWDGLWRSLAPKG
ncbi:MAG: O-antigen ligase family protein [Thermosynechococcaceae cyanobacterium]